MSRPEFSGDLAALTAFWQERHYATLTTHRPDGTPHVVPVSTTYEPDGDPSAGTDGTGSTDGTDGTGSTDDKGGTGGTVRVIASRSSKKVRNVEAAGPDGMRVALCQVDGRRWATLEGRARVRTEPAAVADAERRYAERYGREPRPNPERVVVEIAVDRAMSWLGDPRRRA